MRRKDLIGKSVTNIRLATQAEVETLGWDWRGHQYQLNLVVELEGGLRILAAADDERNEPGSLVLLSERGVETVR